MHYIRILKAPKIEQQNRRGIVKTLVTITTDLGDDFLAAEVRVSMRLMRQDVHAESEDYSCTYSCIAQQTQTWRPGMRSLWLTIPNLTFVDLKSSLMLVVSTRSDTQDPSQAPRTALKHLPDVCPAWSEPFNLTNNGTMKWVERRFAVNDAKTLRICEEMGESIARHVWDAGVVLAAFIHDLVLVPSSHSDDTAALVTKLQIRSGPKVIELGSGCGLVGLQLAKVCPQARLLLTDLPEAMEVLERNISLAGPASGSQISKAVLNWDDSLPAEIAQQTFDLVIVSDCTYNADSIPALVKTFAALVDKSPHILIVVAMKVRHASEAVFHELVAAVGLHECSHWSISVPTALDTDFGEDTEKVDIYAYESH